MFNFKLGAAYLDYVRDRFAAHGRLYLAAYNMGVTNVHRALDKEHWPKEYPLKVMQSYIELYTDLVNSRTPGKQSVKSVVVADKSTTDHENAF